VPIPVATLPVSVPDVAADRALEARSPRRFQMFVHGWRRATIGAVLLTLVLSACKYTGFGNAPITTGIQAAAGYLGTQQQSDGGYEVAGSPGFESPDAIVALADTGQTDYFWNIDEARAAVTAQVKNNKTGLDWLDDFVDSTQNPITAAQAAKIIVLDTKSLGLDATNYDPSNDGVSKNLVAVLDAGLQPDGSYGPGFNGTLYAAVASFLVHDSVAASTMSYIRGAQQKNGGWNFNGDSTDSMIDVDTTSAAMMALVAGGAAADDPALNKALGFLADAQQADGAWQSFGSDDPNSTSTAILGITAAGFDAATSCWRDTVRPNLAGTSYASPIDWLLSQQVTQGADAGRIQSPSDTYGINTFPTSQSVEALRRGWMPVHTLGLRGCS
jgi:Prenyltransferase and squalene oxidase repeat